MPLFGISVMCEGGVSAAFKLPQKFKTVELYRDALN